MKTIFVPVGGANTDHIVIATAIGLARPLAARLRFMHVRLHASLAAQHVSHFGFVRGAAMGAALDCLEADAAARSHEAARHVADACALNNIDMAHEPAACDRVTASWWEAPGDALDRLVFHARRNDLTVMSRAPWH